MTVGESIEAAETLEELRTELVEQHRRLLAMAFVEVSGRNRRVAQGGVELLGRRLTAIDRALDALRGVR